MAPSFHRLWSSLALYHAFLFVIVYIRPRNKSVSQSVGYIHVPRKGEGGALLSPARYKVTVFFFILRRSLRHRAQTMLFNLATVTNRPRRLLDLRRPRVCADGDLAVSLLDKGVSPLSAEFGHIRRIHSPDFWSPNVCSYHTTKSGLVRV